MTMHQWFSFANISRLGLATAIGLLGSATTTSATPQREVAAIPLQQIKVFFPKNPGQQQNLSYVEPVWRQAQTTSVAQFAIAQIIAGPTRQEQQRGFMAPLTLRGASNCGKDFSLSITSTIARLKFCRQVVTGGIGDDARILSSLNTTLKQFLTIRSVVILDQSGNCLGDMSGENRCLRR